MISKQLAELVSVDHCPQCGQQWMIRGEAILCSACGLPAPRRQALAAPSVSAAADVLPELAQKPPAEPDLEGSRQGRKLGRISHLRPSSRSA